MCMLLSEGKKKLFHTLKLFHILGITEWQLGCMLENVHIYYRNTKICTCILNRKHIIHRQNYSIFKIYEVWLKQEGKLV